MADKEKLAEIIPLNTSEQPYGWTPSEAQVKQVVDGFLDNNKGWIDATIKRDPALKDTPNARAELSLYQGLHAIAFHAQAHAHYAKGKGLRQSDRTSAAAELIEARRISQGVRRLTGGIEIHPGAQIGDNFFIDHGAGVVIGETAKIGNDVFLYHDVTLGATAGKEKEEPNEYGVKRRHPKLGDGVICSKGTAILGPVTVGDGAAFSSCALLDGDISVGKNARIGTEALVRGTVTIEDGVRLGAGAQVVTRYEPDAKGKLQEVPITIGAGATIDPGVLITQSVPAGAHVVATTPYLPGIDEKMVGTPVFRGKSEGAKLETSGTFVAQFNDFMKSLLKGFGVAMA
jgi:serine O-acetyltransferase